jgi:hypothetical protein
MRVNPIHVMRTSREMMGRRALAWVEISGAIACLGLATWTVSGMCAGRPLGHDCESWFIFGVNVFAPIGMAALACGLWSLRTSSATPHLMLGAVSLLVLARFVLAGGL